MNKVNNKKRKNSVEKIEKVFLQLIQTKEIEQISVTDICKKANLNRTTFYSNYIDIYDLADKIRKNLENDVLNLYSEEREKKYNSNNFLKLFRHIKENQIFYKTYFKLGFDENFIISEYDYVQASLYYDNVSIDYHIEFFRAGINAIIKKWLYGGCKETPEEIFEIIKSEYKNKTSFFD